MKVRINYCNNKYDIDLRFKPYSSLLFRLYDGATEQLDITFIPDTPVIKSYPEDFTAPWLVN